GVGGNVWLASPTPGIGRVGNIYPSLGAVELNAEEESEDVDMPGAFSPLKFTVTTPTQAEAGHAHDGASSQSVFIFGSPLPQNNLSNPQFSNAASSVLGEMNRRLAEAGVDGVGMDILKRKRL